MTQKSRRKVLKGLAITLPAAWATPVVESVVAPAHARTSPGECSGCVITCTSPTSEAVQDGGLLSATVTVIPAPTTTVDVDLLCNNALSFNAGIPTGNFTEGGGTAATISVADPKSSGTHLCPIGGTWELRAFHPLDSSLTTSCTWEVVSGSG